MEQLQNIELNDLFFHALNLLENTARNILITGRAGTGKSTLLDYFVNHTAKKVAVLAPTGVAALNVGGQTIHSFFGFKPDITIEAIHKTYGTHEKIYKEIDTIIIDEISMVRADLLDCVDAFLKINGKQKHKPFGGVQMVFIGDLYQLPPVVTGKEKEIFKTHYNSPYFFDSHVFNSVEMEFIELEKIYRQTDQKFIDLLNAIRNKSITDEELKEINKRLLPHFEPQSSEFYIYLTTTHALSDAINAKELEKIKEKLYTFQGRIKGNFDKSYLPTNETLHLKTESQIMLVNNDIGRRWVNGTVGKIISIEKDDDSKVVMKVKLPGGKIVAVKPYIWDLSRLHFNNKTKKLESETIGSFTQYPLKLAWAVTIHKGQGKTFDKVIIDIGTGTFTHGQIYVALSRCTNLEGIVLKKRIEKKHIWMDWRVVQFLTKYQYALSNKKISSEEKIKLIKEAIQSKSKLAITYLKSNDQKSKRIVAPKKVGEMEYQGKSYLGVEGYCFKRKDDRVFRVDRILEIDIVKE